MNLPPSSCFIPLRTPVSGCDWVKRSSLNSSTTVSDVRRPFQPPFAQGMAQQRTNMSQAPHENLLRCLKGFPLSLPAATYSTGVSQMPMKAVCSSCDKLCSRSAALLNMAAVILFGQCLHATSHVHDGLGMLSLQLCPRNGTASCSASLCALPSSCLSIPFHRHQS